MKTRKWAFLVLVFSVSVLLVGCGNDPDKLFSKGEYEKAYPLFIERAGPKEVALKTETTNGNFDSRNNAGNQAIHDYYYAAECQAQLGNNQEAEALYRRVVGLSEFKIRIPNDKGALLKDSMDSYFRSLRELRNQEVDYGRRLEDWENRPPSGGTDPFDDDDTDPFDDDDDTDPFPSSGSSGSNTDPFNDYDDDDDTDPFPSSGSSSSNTDPFNDYDYDDDDDTDPFGSSSSSGSSTDPFASPAAASSYSDDAPSRWWLDSAYSTMRTRQRDFERLLYATTSGEMPDIASIRTKYESFSRQVDNYCMYGAPGGILFSPDSLVSQIAWSSLESAMDGVRRDMYSASSNVIYEEYALTLKEPQLVAQAKAALARMGVDLAAEEAAAPEDAADAAETTADDTSVTVDGDDATPFGQ